MNDCPQFMDNYSVRGCGERPIPARSSFWFSSLSYMGHILFCCTLLVFYFCFLCFFASWVFFLPLFIISHSAPWCHILSHSSSTTLLSISFCLPISSFSFPHLCTAHQGFCPGCRHCTNWRTGTFVISPLSGWARRWVQSEPHSRTQISHRAGTLATHRQPNSRSARALISRTCFSCNIRAVSRSTHWGQKPTKFCRTGS